MTTNGTVLTFFSYKGGAGRTMLLANVAWLLAEWGYEVLCIDFGLDAPGLARYLGRDVGARVRAAPGLLEWLERAGEEGPMAPPPVPVEVSVGLRRVAVISAGVEDERYFQRLAAVEWRTLETRGFGRAVEEARTAWVERYDSVLVDARAGSTLIGALGVCRA